MSKAHIGSTLILNNSLAGVDNSTVAYFPFKNNANDAIKGLAPTGSPVYQLKDDAVYIEEATTNLITGTYLNFVNWTIFGGATITLTQNISVPKWNTTSATRIQSTGGTNTLKYYKPLGAGTAGTAITISVLIYNQGTSAVYLRGNEIGGSVIVAPGEYKYCTLSKASVSGTGDRQLRFETAAVDDAMDIIAFQPQGEEKAYPTSFVNGSRSAAYLSYASPFDPRGTWTVCGKTKRVNTSGWQTLFQFGVYYQANQSEFEIWLNHTNMVRIYSHDNQVGRSLDIMTPNAGELEEWFSWVVTRDSLTNTYSVYLLTKDRYIKKTIVINHPNPIQQLFGIGCRPNSVGSNVLNGAMKNVALYNRVLSEGEALQLMKSNNSFYYSNEAVKIL